MEKPMMMTSEKMTTISLKIRGINLSSLVNQDVFEDKETCHLLNCDDLVCFIIGGTKFQILKSKFAYWPKTRLSMLIRAKNKINMLKLCDNVIFCEISGKPIKYIFLRSGKNFNSILDTHDSCIKYFDIL